MVSMYMQECLQMQVAMHYMQAKFLQVALMFVLQVQAGCCSLDYIKTVAVVYIIHAHVLERLYDIYVGIDFGFCDSFVLIDIHALKYFLLVDFTPSLFKVMEMIKSQAKNLFYIHCKKILKWSCSIHGDPDGHVAIYA